MLTKYINQYPLLSFLIVNYIISWAFLYPSYQMILEAEEGIPPLAFIGLIGAYGPTVAAIIITYIIRGKAGLKGLWRLAWIWKVSWKWILFIVLAPILIYLLSTSISFAIGYPSSPFDPIAGISSIPLWFLVALPFGPMGEELGWRGFLLPKLLEKHSMLKSSILVGLAWGFWHLAAFTFPGAAIPDFLDVGVSSIAVYFGYTIAESLIFTFVFFKTKGSVFMAILLHAFFNAGSNINTASFGAIDAPGHNAIIYYISILLTALVGFVLLKSLNKGDLDKFRKAQNQLP